MYKKGAKGWLKHYDFILLDVVSLHLAFLLSFFFRHGMGNPYSDILYRNMSVFLLLGNLTVVFFLNSFKNVLKRGYYKEFTATFKNVFLLQLLSTLYLVTTKEAEDYSRVVLYSTGFFYFGISYIIRILWKTYLKRQMKIGGKKSLLIVTVEKEAKGIIQNIIDNNFKFFLLRGIIILDRDMVGEEISGVRVVANAETAVAYACREWVDEVFISLPNDVEYPHKMVEKFIETGVTMHLNLTARSERLGNKTLVERMCGYTVLTTSINYALPSQMFLKRSMDIVGGLLGCLLTGILFLFIAPIIYLKSPGPIFFSQKRVGMNGKIFKIYKFRSMYLDAEERKKELMSENRVADGMMFKMDFDPRIIGNRILPDGTKKTGIGQFIRSFSLDEFPQFYNVLKGEMSLVGTRPPTVEEYEKYAAHHKARLAIKPGITGMWQVSGRSEITDFEEVVRLDTEYINEWDMGMDLRILARTVKVVVKGRGSL